MIKSPTGYRKKNCPCNTIKSPAISPKLGKRSFRPTIAQILSTGEPCTCEYVTLPQLFDKGTLGIQWYLSQNGKPSFPLSVLFRRCFKNKIFSRFLKVATTTSNVMNKLCNWRFAPESSISMLKEISALVWSYLYEFKK